MIISILNKLKRILSKSSVLYPLLAVILIIVFVPVYLEIKKQKETYEVIDGSLLSSYNINELKKVDTVVTLDRGGIMEMIQKTVFIKDSNPDAKIKVYMKVNQASYKSFEEKLSSAAANSNIKTYSMAYNSYDGIDKLLGTKVLPPSKALTDGITFKEILFNFGPMVFILFGMYFLLRMKDVTKIEMVAPEDIDITFNDIVGLDEVKAELMQFGHHYQNKELYAEYNINTPFNVMLTGPAGTGKTITAKAFAKYLNIPMYYLSCSSLQTGYVGGGTRTLKELVKKAKSNKRAIIFIDEAESILQSRMGQQTQKYEKDTITTLLSLMDGVSKNDETEIIWFVASNMDENNTEMDEATLRRFQLKVSYRLPNFEERKTLIERLLDKINENNKASEINISNLASVSAKLSPAVIQTIITKSCLIAIQEGTKVSDDTLLRAFERTLIGYTERTKSNEESRLRVARHEVGHFLMSVKIALDKGIDILNLSDHLNVIKISTESVTKYNALGYELKKEDEEGLLDLNALEMKVMHLYGGLANEEVYYGVSGLSSGASDDLKKATNLLNTMVSELGLYQLHKVNYHTIDKNLSTPQQIELIEQQSSKLYKSCLSYLMEQKDLSNKLVDFLMDNFVMNVDEAVSIVNQHYKELEPKLISEN